jgi:Methionine synthase I, cobalamin-binding domain
MGQEQDREGAHVIDVCTAYVGRDEVRDMTEVLRRFNAVITKPLMIDSTEVRVIEESLKLVSGKPIINSVNLEDGREKFDKIVGLARKYGAALVCGCIDERGMARTAQTKFEVAARIYEICTTEYGLPPSDLLFDPLVLPVSTGQGGGAPQRARNARRYPPNQAGPSGGAHHGRAVERQLRPESVLPAGREQRLFALRDRIRARLGHPARGQDHSAGVD